VKSVASLLCCRSIIFGSLPPQPVLFCTRERKSNCYQYRKYIGTEPCAAAVGAKWPPPLSARIFQMKGLMMISVRQADGSDAELLTNLNRFVQELHVMHMPQLFKPADTSLVAGWFRTMLQNPAARAWIAEVEGTAAGYVMAVTYDRPETPFCFRRVYCEIDQISVSPEFRKKGVAKALVERVLAEARSTGIQDIELNSWSFNTKAHDAFGALGFLPQIVRFTRTNKLS
jgi:GNAT superfamily N-acetyltransferase